MNIKEQSIDEVAVDVYDLRVAFRDKNNETRQFTVLDSKSSKINLLDSWTDLYSKILMDEQPLPSKLVKKIIMDNLNNFTPSFNDVDFREVFGQHIKERLVSYLVASNNEHQVKFERSEANAVFSKINPNNLSDSFANFLHDCSIKSISHDINKKTGIYNMIENKISKKVDYPGSKSMDMLSDAVYQVFKGVYNNQFDAIKMNIQSVFLENVQADISSIKKSVYQKDNSVTLGEKIKQKANQEPVLIKLNKPSMSLK